LCCINRRSGLRQAQTLRGADILPFVQISGRSENLR